MNNYDNNELIILFDGVCNLCSGIVSYIVRKDKKATFKFAALQSEEGRFFLERYKMQSDKLDTFVYIRKNKALTKSSAALFVLKDLGGCLNRSLFFFIITPKFTRDFFYDLIAKSRYKIWGKKEYCAIPNYETKPECNKMPND